MRILKIGGVVVISLTILYLLGPMPSDEPLDPIVQPLDIALHNLDAYLATSERQISIKPDNEARIIWADSSQSKTQFSVVYLHGFSASQGDGFPVHHKFAQHFGYNLFLARLHPHGVAEDEPLMTLTARGLVEEAKKALAIGALLGERVIIMSCSTGGTLALFLAAHNPQVHSLICFSPNVDMYDPLSHLLNNHWGECIAQLAHGGKYRSWEAPPEAAQYWNLQYRVESLVELRQLVDQTMYAEVFKAIRQPTLIIGFYKNENEQDKTVSIKAMSEMYKQLGTPEALKQIHLLGSVGSHMLASNIFSTDIDTVERISIEFMEMINSIQGYQ